MKKALFLMMAMVVSVVFSTGAMAVEVYGWSGTLPMTLIVKGECKYNHQKDNLWWQKSVVYKKGEVMPTQEVYPDVWYYLSLVSLPNGGGVCEVENESIGRRVFDRVANRFIPSVNYWDSSDSLGILIVKVTFNGIVWIREIVYNPNDFPDGSPTENEFPEVWEYVYSIPIPDKPCLKDDWRKCPSKGRREYSIEKDEDGTYVGWLDEVGSGSGGCFITSTRW